MTAPFNPSKIEDDFLARVTDIAYRALLARGLRDSFVDVELELWQDVRSAYASSLALAGKGR
jgi:hypothetical protein